MDVNSLRKEYQQAFAIFLLNQAWLPCLEHFSRFISPESPLLPTNFVASSKTFIKKSDLPKGENWDWGQSSSKATLFLPSGTKLTFWKVNTRKKCSIVKPPSFKIWIFSIEYGQNTINSFVWCEKGVEGNTVATEIGHIFPQYLTTDDLAFLAPFADCSTAVELGWKPL